MQTKLGHIQFNIEPANLGFYRELYGALGWSTLHEDEGGIGVGDANGVSLWFMCGVNGAVNDHDGAGLNHIAMHTETPAEVDELVAFLRARGVALLYGTPCHRPEWESESDIYYSAMFDAPDRILMEVVYSGPREQ